MAGRPWTKCTERVRVTQERFLWQKTHPQRPRLLTRKTERDDDWEKYEINRKDVCKGEDDAEKAYDTALLAVASIAIGATFPLLKDITSTASFVFIVISWSVLGSCFVIALLDRLLSYYTHMKWREILDEEFDNWTPGAWKRCKEKHGTIPFLDVLPTLKWWGFGTLLGGLILLMVGAAVGWSGNPKATPAPIMNNFTPTQTFYSDQSATKPLACPHSWYQVL
jgi:hypothetical protein